MCSQLNRHVDAIGGPTAEWGKVPAKEMVRNWHAEATTLSFGPNRRLWPPLLGSVPMLVGAVFFVKIASSDRYGFQGLDVLISGGLAVCGLFIVALNLLATSRRPTAAFIGGLVGIGVSLLLTYGVTQVADSRIGVASVIWCAANTGVVLYALERGPVSPEVDSI